MYIGMTASICSLIYTCLILVVYFRKTKLKNDENAIYGFMIFSNTGGLMLEFLVYLFALIPNVESALIPAIIERLYFAYLFTWVYLFAIYIYIISFEHNAIKYKIITNKKVMALLCLIYFILMGLILTLPIEHVISDAGTYSTGPACYVLYLSAVASVIVSLIFVIKNKNKMESKKKIPMISLIACIIAMLIIRFLLPEGLFISTMLSFVTILTYFTIENPDIKIMKELNFSKQMAEKSKNETMDILDDMSKDLNSSLEKLVAFGYKKINNNNLEEVNKEIKSIQQFSLKLADKISGVIDLAKIESSSFEVVCNKYETDEMFGDIKTLLVHKKANRKITITTEFDEIKHKVLYGDADKIKQTILYVAGQIMDIVKTGAINVKATSLSVGKFCRLRFHFYVENPIIKDYICYDSTEKQYYLRQDISNYDIINKLLSILKGKIEIKTEESNMTEIVISLDQRVVPEYDVESVVVAENNTKIRYFDISDKRILIVDDSKSKIKEIIRLLKPYKVNIEAASNKIEMYNKLDSDKVFDLILIDDIIPNFIGFDDYEYSTSIDTYVKNILKKAGYDVPLIILVTPNGNDFEKLYVESGFNDYILKPINKITLYDILNKHINRKNDNK